MIRMIRERAGWWVGLGVGLVGIWVLGEYFLETDELVWSLRWAWIVGLGAYPLLWQIYRIGLHGTMKQTILCVGLSIIYKLSVIVLTAAILFVWFTIDVIVYSFLLFFLLFGLSFFAIYLADIERNLADE